METNDRTSAKGESRRKRIAFIALGAMLSLLLLEAGSWTMLSIRDRRPFSPRRYQDQRRQVLAADLSEILELEVRREPAPPVLEMETLHPYLGFVSASTPWGVSDRSPLRHRSADSLIIGVVGGSVGRYIADLAGDELLRTLRKAPRFKNKKIALVNLALGGFKQPQQLMMLNYMLAAGGEFDILVNLDGFNEVALHPTDDAPKGVSYLYPRQWAARSERAPDFGELRVRGELVLLSGRRRAWADELSKRPLAWSMTANLIWGLEDRRLTNSLIEARSRLLDYKTGAPNVGPPAPYTDEAGMYTALVALWKRGSIQLDRLSRENGIKYYHFLQPNQYLDGSKRMGESERAIAYSATEPYAIGVRRGYPLLRQAGVELGKTSVHFRDLTMLFLDHEEPLYLDNCCHYNKRGNALVAQAIGETIAAEGP